MRPPPNVVPAKLNGPLPVQLIATVLPLNEPEHPIVLSAVVACDDSAPCLGVRSTVVPAGTVSAPGKVSEASVVSVAVADVSWVVPATGSLIVDLRTVRLPPEGGWMPLHPTVGAAVPQ